MTALRSARRLASGGPFTAVGMIAGLVIVVLILYPLANLIGGLFVVKGDINLIAFTQTLSEPDLGTVLLNTVIYVALSGVAALVVGALLAWLSERTDASLGPVTNVLPLVPLFLPSLAGAIGWVLLCAPRAGLINIALRAITGSPEPRGPIDIFTLPGIVFVTSIHLVPFAYLAVSSALRNLDASLEEASRVSGAGLGRTVARVSLPIVTPALFSGAVLIVMAGVTLFTIPAVLGGTAQFPVLATLIYKLIQTVFPPRVGEAILLCVLALSVIQVLIWSQLALGNRSYRTIGTQGLRRVRVRLGAARFPARVLIVVYFFAAAILPLIGLFVVSVENFWSPVIAPDSLTLDNYRAVFSFDPNAPALTALRNSLGLGIAVAIIDLTIAVLLAYYLARAPGILSRALDVISTLPATVPHIVMGVAFLLAFSRPPLVLYGTVVLIFLAYVAIAMPQAMQFAKFTFHQINPELGEASRVFGASEGRTFLHILMPLLLPSAVAGGIVVAVQTLNETNASIMLATVDSVVVGPTMYALWEIGKIPLVAAFAVVICVFDSVLALSSTYVGRALSAGRTS